MMLVNDYLQVLHLNRRLPMNIDWGPLHFHTVGRPVFFFWITITLLAFGGVAVFASRRRELIRKWTSWAMIAPAVAIPIWSGRVLTTVLVAVLALIAVLEYGRLVRLGVVDSALLCGLALFYPAAALWHLHWSRFAPFIVLVCALPAVLTGDIADGSRRAAFTGLGSVWICWSLAQLVVQWQHAFVLCCAAAATDVAAWCGGKGLRRFGWARRQLSPLSPNKTIGGLVGAVVGAFVVLTVLGTMSLGLLFAVAFGAVFGDLLESMVKRQAQVKDAGTWLPGFGGLLDRIDSLLLVLPLAGVLA